MLYEQAEVDAVPSSGMEDAGQGKGRGDRQESGRGDGAV